MYPNEQEWGEFVRGLKVLLPLQTVHVGNDFIYVESHTLEFDTEFSFYL